MTPALEKEDRVRITLKIVSFAQPKTYRDKLRLFVDEPFQSHR